MMEENEQILERLCELQEHGHSVQATPREDGPVMRCLADVEPEAVEWLWPSRVAIGKLTLLAGDPGLGKSFLTLDMAARVSTGQKWPDCDNPTASVGGVVLLNAEDDAADTIRPRLDAVGADVRRIYILDAIRSRGIDRTFDLSRDLRDLEKKIREVKDCRLVVIDPVTAYLGGVDSHKNAEMRTLLAPLSGLASRCCVAVVAVTHLNKAGGGPAIYRAMGSLAFAAAARSVWAVTKDKTDAERRLFVSIKNNNAANTGGLAFRIMALEGGAAMVEWDSAAVSVSADEALAPDSASGGGRSKRNDAAEWLLEFLRVEPRPASEVERDAKDAEFSFATLKRAKEACKVVALKSGYGGHWVWALPDQVANFKAQEEQRKKLKEADRALEGVHLP